MFKYVQILIITEINLNSIRNKFELLTNLVTSNIDALMISEMKIDESFPISQFLIDGLSSPYRLNRNEHEGDILLYFKSNITTKPWKTKSLSTGTETTFIEMKIRNKK